jgi:ribosomal protein L44E
VAQVFGCLLSKCEALSSNAHTVLEKKKNPNKQINKKDRQTERKKKKGENYEALL